MNLLRILELCLLVQSTFFYGFLEAYNSSQLGGWAISAEVLEYILETFPAGSTILELGSGSGTGELAKYYKMYSIEHNPKWLHKYNSTYIYAPIKDYGTYKWYDVAYLKKALPKHYDLILIDGPLGSIGRYGFFHHMGLFDTDVTILFDDTNRAAERKLFNDVAAKLKRETVELDCTGNKTCSIIKGLNF